MNWMSFFFRGKSAPSAADATGLCEIIAKIRANFDGFNSSADGDDLVELAKLYGTLPADVSRLYQDHDGSDVVPSRGKRSLVARLMPLSEVGETCSTLSECEFPKVGSILWLWTDDNSNYCGVYADGPLRGWICVLNHEEPMLTPAFRATASFLSRLFDDACRADSRTAACDIPTLSREIPQLLSDPANLESDRQLVALFRQRYKQEPDEDLRRLNAHCAICLTPVEDTRQVLSFLTDADMWTPDAAIRLLEVRQWRDGTEELERLAREGGPNGDSAAMRLLARMDTNQSREAIVRLKSVLQGDKLKALVMWTDGKIKLQPPRW